jgi:hypothetical protein
MLHVGLLVNFKENCNLNKDNLPKDPTLNIKKQRNKKNKMRMMLKFRQKD